MKQLGTKGIYLITKWEGYEGHAYPDPKTKGDPWTIGYGSTYWLYDDGVAKKVKPGDIITPDEAVDQLKRSCQLVYSAAVSKFVTAPLTQSMHDAIVSWTYNLGVGRLKSSTALRLVNARRYTEAIDSFSLWISPGSNVETGLRRRRAEEKLVFLSEGLPK